MFLQVPFPQGCRSHSSMSAERRSQLIQGLSELKVTVSGVQTGSRQLHNTPVACKGQPGIERTQRPLAVLGTTQRVLERAHVHPDP